MQEKRDARAAIVAGWIATMEGQTVYLSEEADPDLFHTRKDCPKSGSEPIEAKIVDGIITSPKGFYFRDVVPCSRCILNLSRT
jgi:hypothetical protein